MMLGFISGFSATGCNATHLFSFNNLAYKDLLSLKKSSTLMPISKPIVDKVFKKEIKSRCTKTNTFCTIMVVFALLVLFNVSNIYQFSLANICRYKISYPIFFSISCKALINDLGAGRSYVMGTSFQLCIIF